MEGQARCSARSPGVAAESQVVPGLGLSNAVRLGQEAALSTLRERDW